MQAEVKGFTGYENKCEIVYFDDKGEYSKTRMIENLVFELKINARGNHSVGISSLNCIVFDDKYFSGKVEELPKHEIYKIEKLLSECVDWESWDMSQEFDADDFLTND